MSHILTRSGSLCWIKYHHWSIRRISALTCRVGEVRYVMAQQAIYLLQGRFRLGHGDRACKGWGGHQILCNRRSGQKLWVSERGGHAIELGAGQTSNGSRNGADYSMRKACLGKSHFCIGFQSDYTRGRGKFKTSKFPVSANKHCAMTVRAAISSFESLWVIFNY